MHRGILYVHQTGVTSLAPALVVGSLLRHGHAIVTLTPGKPQHSKQAFATQTFQKKCFAPETGQKIDDKENIGEIRGRKNTVGYLGQGKSRKMGTIHGLCYTVNY